LKKFRNLVALVLAMMMVFALVGSAMADVNITINRDGTYNDDASGTRSYTWYRVFTATPADVESTNTQQTPGTISTTVNNAAYVATAEVAAKLGSWDANAKTWTKKAASGTDTTGNQWFDLTPIAGTNTFSVAWSGAETAARAQAAAEWLIANEV